MSHWTFLYYFSDAIPNSESDFSCVCIAQPLKNSLDNNSYYTGMCMQPVCEWNTQKYLRVCLPQIDSVREINLIFIEQEPGNYRKMCEIKESTWKKIKKN